MTALVLLLIAMFAGLATVAFVYFYRTSGRTGNSTESAASRRPTLSDATLQVLAGLKAPVQIRFYSLLDPKSPSADLRAFAGRVDKMLLDYERTANGEVSVVRITDYTQDNLDAAFKGGLRVFGLEKGDGCYLGMVVEHDDQKQILARLSEEWERAIEFDLSRAIATVENGSPAPTSPTRNSKTEIAAARELLHAKPELASASVDKGTEILRRAALDDFQLAVKDSQSKLQAAEQHFKDAEKANSEAGKLAARNEILQIQADQLQKTKAISERLQQQIAVFQQIKRTAQ